MDEQKVKDAELEQAAGGYGGYGNQRRVSGLQKGYLAMRTAAYYDANNEIRGAELHNGDVVIVQGAITPGGDGRTYVWVYSPRTGVSGYVNASFLA